MKGDTISRAAALSALNGLTEIYLNNLPPTIYKSDAVDAIKALPSATDTNVGGNLIDRGAALEAMETWDKFGCDPDGKLVRYDDDKHYIPYVHYEDMVHAIKHMPSAQPGWIPVTERLPKDDTEVIVSCTDDSGDYEYSYVTTGWHYKGLWVVNNDRCYFVKAWQPLPAKPWEGGQDNG